MNKKIIKQYGEEILSYRLRTARHKKRKQYEDFHKRLIELSKQQWILRRQQFNLGWEPLVPPVQKGWKRLFVLRHDVARSAAADFYNDILKKINTVEWSHRKDFMRKKRAFGRKKYVVREQYLLKPDEQHFRKLAFSEAEQTQFHEEWNYEKGSGRIYKRYVFNEPWRFVLRVKPNIITRIRKIDPQLEAELQRIKNYMERNDYGGTQSRLLHGNQKWGWRDYEKHDEVNPHKNKPLQTILDELKEETI